MEFSFQVRVKGREMNVVTHSCSLYNFTNTDRRLGCCVSALIFGACSKYTCPRARTPTSVYKKSPSGCHRESCNPRPLKWSQAGRLTKEDVPETTSEVHSEKKRPCVSTDAPDPAEQVASLSAALPLTNLQALG